MKTVLFIVLGLLVFASPTYAAQTANLDVGWTANSTNELGFSLERCVGEGCSDFREVRRVGAGITKTIDRIPDDPGATTYCYRVRAFNHNASGQEQFSGYSNIACGKTPVVTVPPPGAPSGMSVSVTVSVTVSNK